MILHEATDKDIGELATFAYKELKAWGYSKPLASEEHYLKMQAQGTRFASLTEDGEITAVLAVNVVMTMAKEKLCIITLLFPAYDHPDKLQAMDALVLWGCNRLLSEGVFTIASGRNSAQISQSYGELVGMVSRVTGVSAGTPRKVSTSGSVKTVIQLILERRPTWQLSP